MTNPALPARAFVALSLSLCLGACSGLLESNRPAEHTWWLEPLAAPVGDPAPTGRDLTVSLNVVPGLDTDRVLTLNDDARLSHYAGARWVDHIPELLESLVVRSLQNNGAHAQVSARHPATDACHLELNAERFYSQINGGGQTTAVAVSISGFYRCEENASAVAASHSVAVRGNRMPAVIAAYQRGFELVMMDLIGSM